MRFKSAVLFSSLNRKQGDLESRDLDLQKLIHEVILPGLVEFESSRGAVPEQLVVNGFRFLVKIGCELSRLDLKALLALHGEIVPGSVPQLRRVAVRPLVQEHCPTEPASIETALNRFFEWSQSQSFAEMHVVEQLTVAQIRLHEIYPFQIGSEVTVSLFSYWFLLSSGFLLPAFQFKDVSGFDQALNSGLNLQTEDLVGLNIRAMERSYDLALAAV